MSLAILYDTTENLHWFHRFKQGDEKALEHIYRHTHKIMHWHGHQYLDDPFELCTIIQDAYLKAWLLRDRMQSMPHIFRFIRLAVKWSCANWYRDPRNSFRQKNIHSTDNTEIFESQQQYQHEQATENTQQCFRQRIEAIEKVIAYLPPTRQNMVTLHFKQGLSYKAIALRYGASHVAIRHEVEKALGYLKKMILLNTRSAAARNRRSPATATYSRY